MTAPRHITTWMASAVLGALAATVLAATAQAQAWQQPTQQQAQQRSPARVDAGQRAYEAHCASCHGMGGRGDGPMRSFLTVAPSDLTTIARRNGGAFPEQLVWEMIDGRSSISIGPHGSREMPVWGQEFREESRRRGDQNPEWSARNRIVALLGYLSTIQQR